ncbi:hypothetical protein LAZ67_9003443 [Cordylochernes scorpioides]|uniref:Uncharacterized protein n=1 Tax=Cordylochernes scorpioides TaxID=51811 RepID=A0ABY6KUG9_9ARAC|nr:hypothetical protein LAZ67_9003443 [Cordylochernes scorpioides]
MGGFINDEPGPSNILYHYSKDSRGGGPCSSRRKIQQIENELDQVQEQLAQANNKLEEKDKALQNVSTSSF